MAEENGLDRLPELYRLPGGRKKKSLGDEMAKFSLSFALSEHSRAEEAAGRHKFHRGMNVAAVKAGILGGNVNPGDELEGEGLASPFAAVYQPRAYYPAYALGEMRAALRRGEGPPSASPHYLPVSLLPPLPDGWRVNFLYPPDKEAFDRPDFPAHSRDVLTRAYNRLPLLIPPQSGEVRGRVRFRARLKRLSRDTLGRLAGLGDDSCDLYAARGLAHFLFLDEVLEEEAAPSLRGSLFAEVDLGEGAGWDKVMEVLEDSVCGLAAEAFPEYERGDRQDEGCRLPGSGHQVIRFRRRLFALVFDPVIAVYRSPGLLGLYLPWDLGEEPNRASSRFEAFLRRLTRGLEEKLGLSEPPRIEVAYDNLLPWAREGGALRGAAFQAVEEERPFLRPTLRWLRGG